MKIRYIILTLFLVFLNNVSFAANEVSCGVNKSCSDGYYCTGAVGESESGVCVANAVNIALCRFVDYIRSDIVKYFILFASVFAGIYFFIGKFALITFAQIMVGMSVLLGSQQLIIKITGSSKGLCTQAGAQDCAANATTISVLGESTVVRNLAEISIDSEYKSDSKTYCKALECVLAECDSYKIIPEVKNDKGVVIAQRSCEKTGSKSVVNNIPHASNSGGDSFSVVISTSRCPSLTVNCTATIARFQRDYFDCTNTCTGKNFAGEADSKWKIQNCAELMKKQIK